MNLLLVWIIYIYCFYNNSLASHENNKVEKITLIFCLKEELSNTIFFISFRLSLNLRKNKWLGKNNKNLILLLDSSN